MPAATKRRAEDQTYRDFRAVLVNFETDNPLQRRGEDPSPIARLLWERHRLSHALWWFIENVDAEDASRTQIFFELREMVREMGAL